MLKRRFPDLPNECNSLHKLGATTRIENTPFFGGGFMRLQGTNVFSISVWVFYDGISGFGFPQICNTFFAINPPNAMGWKLFTNQSGSQERVTFQMENTSSNVLAIRSISTKGIRFGVPNHIVITNDGSSDANNTKMYINGEEVAEILSNTLLPSDTIIYSALGLGANHTIGVVPVSINPTVFGFNFQRHINLVEYFNRVLTQDDVDSVYNQGRPFDRSIRQEVIDDMFHSLNLGGMFNFFGTGARIPNVTPWGRSKTGDPNGQSGFMVFANEDFDALRDTKRISDHA